MCTITECDSVPDVTWNQHSSSPFFEIADIDLVGDLFKVIPELEKLLA